ncbi:sodium-dependent serotonin transporter-like [Gigantopelta aegis]|uniref:sodium-dependent serotonin transporter-like n=1 Tax=Gigantopelta aegis TaxID=1735272 RepID=UPI001B88AAE4|nr:sodium-dependent serotonin transporter-like [Gigantopelta aegis]XP_041350516.1 sodium-dependent serotonin transporter-like [Gigantopelta aegis]
MDPNISTRDLIPLQQRVTDPNKSKNMDKRILRNPDYDEGICNLSFDNNECGANLHQAIQANREMAKTAIPVVTESFNKAPLGSGLQNRRGKKHMDVRARLSSLWQPRRRLGIPIPFLRDKFRPKSRSDKISISTPVEEDEPTDDRGDDRGDDRETWSRKADFILSVVGFVVDLGNVWRFPYICYKNGGGSFLIPYFLMMVFLGMPLFYMELALGQYQRAGAISVWLRICPMFCGIGYGICVVSTLVGAYYNTIISWAFYFLISSFRSEVPWGLCNQTWNTPDCVTVDGTGNASNSSQSSAEEYFERQVLELQKSTGIDDLGSVKWSLALCLLLTFLIIYFSLWKGIKQSGKVVWVTATAPYVFLIILLVRGCMLPGALEGITYFLNPQFETLLTAQIWIDAAAQTFFSLGPGFGVLLALSSYNKFNNNCFSDAVLTTSINCVTSLLAGLVVFSMLGYMADLQHTTIDQVAVDGPGLVFVAYPEAIATFAGSQFWAVLFFFMLITLGLDSSFGGLESAVTAMCDQFPNLKANRPIVLGVQLGLCFLIGLSTVTYGGSYVVYLLDVHAAPTAVIFFCFVEVVAVNWVYGFDKFSSDIKAMLGYAPGVFIRVCWVVICPLALLALLVVTVYKYEKMTMGPYVYPDWSNWLGWCVSCSSMLCVPGFMIYWFITSKGNFKQKLLLMVHPVDLPTPAPKEIVLTAQQSNTDEHFKQGRTSDFSEHFENEKTFQMEEVRIKKERREKKETKVEEEHNTGQEEPEANSSKSNNEVI